MVIALVVKPEGMPLSDEVMEGNTSDRTTLQQFLDEIERPYGKARRVRTMGCAIPTEEILTEVRQSRVPISRAFSVWLNSAAPCQ
jgi:hypothetical protein